MINMLTQTDRQPSWQDLLAAVKNADADLQADDVNTDELINFYCDALTQALMAFMLEPVSTADALHTKMKLFAEHEFHNRSDAEFQEVWAVMMADVERMALATPSNG